MSQFSPTVLPQAAPGFLENLSNALNQGFRTYQGIEGIANDREDRQYERTTRRMAIEDHARAQGRQDDEDFIHGIRPAGYVDPVTPGSPATTTTGAPPGPRPFGAALSEAMNAGPVAAVAPSPKPPTAAAAMSAPAAPAPRSSGMPSPEAGGGYGDELAAALAGQTSAAVASPTATSDSGHPGGWNSQLGTFVQPGAAPVAPSPAPASSSRLAPMALPSGRVYDRQGQVDMLSAQKAAERNAILEEEQAKALFTSDRRRAVLQGLKGQRGFEKLSDAMIAAGAEDPETFRHIVENKPEAYHPTTLAEALAEHGAEAEQTAAANERHRSRLSNTLAPAMHASVQVSKQISDTGRELTQAEKDEQKHPIDMAITSADSATSKRATDAVARLRARSDSLNGVRDRLNDQVTKAGLGEDFEQDRAPSSASRTATSSGQPASHPTGFPKASQDEFNQAYRAAGGDANGNVDRAKLAAQLRRMKRT